MAFFCFFVCFNRGRKIRICRLAYDTVRVYLQKNQNKTQKKVFTPLPCHVSHTMAEACVGGESFSYKRDTWINRHTGPEPGCTTTLHTSAWSCPLLIGGGFSLLFLTKLSRVSIWLMPSPAPPRLAFGFLDCCYFTCIPLGLIQWSPFF